MLRKRVKSAARASNAQTRMESRVFALKGGSAPRARSNRDERTSVSKTNHGTLARAHGSTGGSVVLSCEPGYGKTHSIKYDDSHCDCPKATQYELIPGAYDIHSS